MSAEDIYKHMTPAPPRRDPRTPGQIVVDAMKEYVRLKEQVMPRSPSNGRDEVREAMRDLRGVIASYMGLPYSSDTKMRYADASGKRVPVLKEVDDE